MVQDSAEIALDLDQYVMSHQDVLIDCGADGLGRSSSLSQVEDVLRRVRDHLSDLGSRDVQLSNTLAEAERSLAGNEALITGKISDANAKRERLEQLTLSTGPQQTEVINRLNELRNSNRYTTHRLPAAVVIFLSANYKSGGHTGSLQTTIMPSRQLLLPP